MLLPAAYDDETVGEPAPTYREDMSSSVPIRSGTLSDRAVTSSERTEIVDRIIDAADEERLDIGEAGRLVSLTYRARERGDLLGISRRLDIADHAARRRHQRQALGWLVVFALISVLMIVGLLYGLGPVDPH